MVSPADMMICASSDLRSCGRRGSAPASLFALSRFALHESELNELTKVVSAALARNIGSGQSEGKADWPLPLMRRPGEADTAVSASNQLILKKKPFCGDR